jgi:hypothetical protein
MGNQGGKEKDDKGDHLSREQLEDIHRRSHCTLIARALLPERAVGKLFLSLGSAFYFLLEVALNEISDMFKWFKKEAPTSVITKAEFKGVLQRMGVEDPFLQDLIFKVFDGTKTGCIRFPEFVLALSIITRGTPDEKLECTLWVMCRFVSRCVG